MNRKTAIKSIVALVTLGATSGALYEFFAPGQPMSLIQLPKKKQLIAELAELIIPRTNTPGAKDVKVEDYIIKMITENTDAKAQRSFLTGLGELEHYTANKFNKPFVNCDRNHQAEILMHFYDKANYPLVIMNKVNKKLFGYPFFLQLRDLTVQGYSTSFLGATKGMAYDYIPVNYQACIPMQKNQLAWATK